MHMRIKRIDELEVELCKQLEIPRHVLDDGINDHRLARLLVAEHVGIGRGFRVEELSEDHGYSLARRSSQPRAIHSAGACAETVGVSS